MVFLLYFVKKGIIIHKKHDSKSEDTKPYEGLEKIEPKTKSSTSAKKETIRKINYDTIPESNDTIEEKNEDEKYEEEKRK